MQEHAGIRSRAVLYLQDRTGTCSREVLCMQERAGIRSRAVLYLQDRTGTCSREVMCMQERAGIRSRMAGACRAARERIPVTRR